MAKERPGYVKTPFDELTFQVNGLAMQVHGELRSGHPERMYQRRLAELCREVGLRVEMEKRVEVWIGDEMIGYLFLDLWVEDSLVVECKAFDHETGNNEIGQVLTYLVATGAPVGLLYNFGRRKFEFKRILPPRRVQDWQQYLYRCVWTPPGAFLPQASAEEGGKPIRFSVAAHLPPSASVRLSASPSVEDSASVRSSVSPSVEDSASVRLSASPSVEDSASVRSSVSPSVEDSASRPISDYASSGVNINAGNRAVELMTDAVRATYGPEVLAGIGAFGGLYDASAIKSMKSPVLVASTDGVGTKVKLAAAAGRYRSIGHDIVNHCIDDILVQGARPLFFLDYFATSKLDPQVVAEAVIGAAEACRAAGMALLGGETAEMPGVYAEGEFDLAGTIVGVVERDAALPRPGIAPGDVLIGLRSSGPHTNGYSLIRRVFENVSLDTVFPELGGSLADALLEPHRSYLNLLWPLINRPSSPIKALSHITGGGFLENIPRVLPEGVSAVVRRGSWPVPPLFDLIQIRGGVDVLEMHRVFNMGIGMVIVVAKEEAEALQEAIGEETWIIGELTAGERTVILE